MGMDIHMKIVKDKKVILDNVFEGRNREWFDDLMHQEYEIYSFLPMKYGWDNEIVPQELIDQYNDWCFNFQMVKVGDFKSWYREKSPDYEAGFVPRYDAWQYEARKIYPPEIYKYWHKDEMTAEGWVWGIFENKYSCDRQVFNNIIDNHISDNAWIVFCFDN